MIFRKLFARGSNTTAVARVFESPTVRATATSYRGYDLEQKPLMVGWQITITKDGKFVHNGSITGSLSFAADEAEKFVDDAIALQLTV
jgi:hypothetical protein